jgi:hypothetical protein
MRVANHHVRFFIEQRIDQLLDMVAFQIADVGVQENQHIPLRPQRGSDHRMTFTLVVAEPDEFCFVAVSQGLYDLGRPVR